MVQGQLAEQLVDLTFMAHEAQVRGVQHRRQQGVGGEFGQAVRQAHRQPLHPLGGRLVDLMGHQLADLEDLFRAAEGGLTGFGQHQAAAFGLEQLMAQGAFQLTHLSTDGLHRHAQTVGRTGKAAFLGDYPEVMQVTVIQRTHLTLRKDEAASYITSV